MCKLLKWVRKQWTRRNANDEVVDAEVVNTEKHLAEVTEKHEKATDKLIDQLRRDPLQEFLRDIDRIFRRSGDGDVH